MYLSRNKNRYSIELKGNDTHSTGYKVIGLAN